MSRPEGISAEDQVMIGSRIKHILDKKRERCSFEIETVLKDVSIDFRKHDLMDDRMIFNTAYLLDKDRKDEFEGILDELNNRFDERINFRCVGPLPPYSFYTVEVKKMPFDKIDWARKRLCLNDAVTMAEIEKAYRNQALLYHPDRNLGSPDTGREFDEVTKAYRLLREYFLFVEQESKDGQCSFREEDFEQNLIIVKVRD
jgi:hypothetical protein